MTKINLIHTELSFEVQETSWFALTKWSVTKIWSLRRWTDNHFISELDANGNLSATVKLQCKWKICVLSMKLHLKAEIFAAECYLQFCWVIHTSHLNTALYIIFQRSCPVDCKASLIKNTLHLLYTKCEFVARSFATAFWAPNRYCNSYTSANHKQSKIKRFSHGPKGQGSLRHDNAMCQKKKEKYNIRTCAICPAFTALGGC